MADHRTSMQRTGSRIEQLEEPLADEHPTSSNSASTATSSGSRHNPFGDSQHSAPNSSGPSSLYTSDVSPPQSQQYHAQLPHHHFSPQHRLALADSANNSWHGHTSYYGYGGASAPATPGGLETLMAMGGLYSPSGAATPVSAFPHLGVSHHSAANEAQGGPAPSGTATPAVGRPRQRKLFKSTVLKEGEEVYKPWLENKARRSANRKAYWLFVSGIVIGLISAVAVTYTGWISVKQHKFCLVLDESFSGDTINSNIWFHEQEVGGFGNGQFEWTTDSTNNSYIRDNQLYIVPTLTSDRFGMDAITNGYELNLTTLGVCTAADPSNEDACSVVSNSSTGVVLPPIQSARLITNFSTTIKYGRVEIRAKMPKGDWIWPAVWMMPKDSVYGSWPRSGEIDIFESRGNVLKTRNDDFGNVMHSTLHWGPSVVHDGYMKTTNAVQLFRNYFNQDFHTFGIEWTPEGLYTWHDNPNFKVLAWKFTESFWKLGRFPTASSNGSTITNPWPANGNTVAPFDQEFFLILNVAVGGTNGWFGGDDMPWSNDADNAAGEFWENRNEWLPTWGTDYERGMVVDYVKMWNLEGVEGVECPATPIIN